MSTKTIRNPKAVAKLRGKKLKHLSLKNQTWRRIPIRNSLPPKFKSCGGKKLINSASTREAA